jgi:hypothetical protein
MVIVLLLTATQTGPAYCTMCRLVSSAQSFQQYFRDLESLNPVERFVFSLVLANRKTPHVQEGARS